MIIGIVALVSLLYYWYLSYSQTKSKETVWPPPNYMKYIGSKCPTGWTYKGTQNGKDVCVNMNDIAVADNQSCYTDASAKTMQFDNINWPIAPSAQQNMLQDRCSWIKGCGPTDKTYATWFGIQDLC